VNLILDPRPPRLHWVVDEGGEVTEGWAPFGADELPLALASLAAEVDAVACVVPHGGPDLTAAVSPVTEEALAAVRGARRFDWDGCHMADVAARAALAGWPDARHYLLCETALFADMPPAASRYAVPEALDANGIRRYGAHGLAHRWVYDLLGSGGETAPHRLISVHVDDRPAAACLVDGRAVETTCGFTPVEGVPGLHSCGDVDPTIAMQLCEAGYTPAEVADLLSQRSGLSGVVGRPTSMAEVAAAADDGTRLARDLLVYALVKAVGAGAAAMGGVDAVVLSAPELNPVRELIKEVCSGLGALQMRPLPESLPGATWEQIAPGMAGLEAPRREVLRWSLAVAQSRAVRTTKAAPAA